MDEPTARIETERLTLRLPARGDADAIAQYHARNAEHLAPWSPPRPANFHTRTHWLNKIEQQLDGFADGRSAHFIVTKRAAPDVVIGTTALTEIVRGPWNACLLGYGLDRDEQRHGYMREAVAAAVRYAFESLRLHRVMANYMPTNERSGALLRALGFAVEGYARDYLFIDGKYRDHVLTALTNPEPIDPVL